jgi:EAL domain-containing protein (putative c-di-GMP-specific phosphodiesterase class I)
MNFGDFTDTNFIIFFATILLLGLVIAAVILIFVLSVRGDEKFQEQIDYESTTTRIYIVDVKKNNIIQLNKSDLGNTVTYDLFSFYTSFHPNDAEKVKNWIFQICVDPKSAGEYLEADIILNNSKKLCFTLLRLLEYNPQTGLIHLESHILKYITPNNAPKKKNDSRVPTGIVKRSQILSIISHHKSLSGYTYCIRFFYMRQKVISNDKIEKYMVMNLKNVIYPYANNPRVQRQILDNGDSELFLFDTKISNRESALQLANSISRSLRKQMEVNGFSGSINFAIGVVENSQFFRDYDTIEEKSREACISGQTNGNEVVFYQRNVVANNDMVKYSEQVEHVLKEGTLRYLFRPIINAKNAQTIGYFEYVKAYDSPFSSFSEMSKYAARINKNLDLFALVAKNVISKFNSEKADNTLSLFLSVSMVDINSISSIISQIRFHNQNNIVLVFDEQEINENAHNIELLTNALTKLRNDGFELALSLKDKNLLLDDNIYFLFHYYVVGSAMMEEVKHNNRIRLSLYALLESLMKYNRPIIATDLEGWQAVELIIKSGISYVSSDIIAPSNDMLLPVEKKKMEKANQMANKYL